MQQAEILSVFLGLEMEFVSVTQVTMVTLTLNHYELVNQLISHYPF